MPDVRISVLGRVAVTVDAVDVPILGRRERAVLSVLVAARGEPVSADRLVDMIWGGQAPASAQGSLQVAISRLRAVLEPDRAPRAQPTRLLSVGSGYAVRLPADSIDAERFTALAAAATDTAGNRTAADTVAAADEALALWGGPPYAEHADLPLPAEDATRLCELRLSLLEARGSALLELGRTDAAVQCLREIVADEPFRERAWGLLALALYRSGRQADALDALRQLRANLVDSLGVDPSPMVRQLELDMLAQAPHLLVHAPEAAQRQGRPVARRPSERRTTVVGRPEALAVLHRSVRELVDGRGATLLISGEPGIGKSTMIGELTALAEEHGVTVALGRAHEADVAPAYWPWLPVLREFAGDSPPAEVAVLLRTEAEPTSVADPGAATLRTFDAVVQVLRRAAEAGPIVVVLEDIHWADATSLRLIGFAAEALRSAPVLFVMSRRDVDAPDSPALAATLAALARVGVTRLPLRGLDEAAVAELLHDERGSDDADLARVLADRTDGNPFFVLEFARLLTPDPERAADDARALAVPDGIRDVLRMRVGRLPEPTQQALAAASVVGRDFEAGVVARATGRDVPDVLDELDLAVTSGLVGVDIAGRYRFTHALTRETLYAQLGTGRRLRLHAAVAAALEPRIVADPELVGPVAHHFVVAAAAEPGLAVRAAQHSESAAISAEARGAFDEAQDLWQQAADVELLAPEADPRRRHRLLVGLGVAQQRMGNVGGSRDSFYAATDLARAIGDWDLVSLAATSFRGAGVWHWREFGTVDEEMIELLSQCLAHVQSLPLRAKLLASLQLELGYAWRAAEAFDCGVESIAVARQSGDDEVLLEVLLLHMLAQWGPGSADYRIGLATEALPLATTLDRKLHVRWQLGCALHHAGRPAEADAEIERCFELATVLRHTGSDVPLAWWRFMRAVEQGQPDAAEFGFAARAMHRRTSVVALAEMIGISTLRTAPRGSDVPAEVVAEARVNANLAYRAVIGQALAEAGRVGDAVDLVRDHLPDGAKSYASLAGDCLRVDVLAHAGDSDELRSAMQRITPWADQVVSYGSVDALGSAHYFVARGLHAQGDLSAARAEYERAVEHNARLGNVPWGERAKDRLRSLESES